MTRVFVRKSAGSSFEYSLRVPFEIALAALEPVRW